MAVVIGAGAIMPSVAIAAARQTFDARAGRLGDVVTTLAIQGKATISVADPGLAGLRSPGVRGIMTLRQAIGLALRGTPATARFHDARTIRIVRRAMPATPVRSLPLQPGPTPTPPDTSEEIVVTASKQRSTLDRYPGSVKVATLDRAWTARYAAEGTTALVNTLPTIGATNLGPARNKLFIRGIADSSFAGSSPATVGQYLGDVRLNYNAPDPNLNLYDVDRIEVLVGPQGTLYGASSLGGVVRLVPNVPDASASSASASGGLAATRHGGIGGDFAAMVNVPVIAERLAVRLVGFIARQPGYIDAPAQGRHDINATSSVGQRLGIRFTPDSGWTFDFGLIIQNSNNRDGQYTLAGERPLVRENAIEQPFHNDYYMAHFTTKGSVGEAELVTTTSFVSHQLRSVFDATQGGSVPIRFTEDNRIVLFNHETRISGGTTEVPWVAGFATTANVGALVRTLGPRDKSESIGGVLNEQLEAAFFGQASRSLSPVVTGTVGGRLTLARNTGRLITETGVGKDALSRGAMRFSGTLALDWRPTDRFSAFFHYQQGYRPGGLAVAPRDGSSGAPIAAQRFMADDLNMNEIGLRLGHEGRDPITLRAAIFAADWRSIQADLIDTAGLPYTANIGNGRIIGLDGTLTWKLSPSLSATAAAFVNFSDLYAPAAGFGDVGHNPLPNVAGNGQRLALEWRRTLRNDVTISASGAIRYVGPSRLGIGPTLNIAQGDYAVTSVGARLDRGRFGLSLDIDNIADRRGNTFAFGNPFGVTKGDQITPLRPRSVRLGIDLDF